MNDGSTSYNGMLVILLISNQLEVAWTAVHWTRLDAASRKPASSLRIVAKDSGRISMSVLRHRQFTSAFLQRVRAGRSSLANGICQASIAGLRHAWT